MKTLLTILLMMALPMSVLAQEGNDADQAVSLEVEKVKTDGEDPINIMVMGAMSFYEPTVEVEGRDASLDQDTSFGFGAFFDMPLTERLKGEFGAQLNNREYFITGDRLGIRQSTTFLTIPAIGRYFMTEKFSAGLGPYLGVRVGAVESSPSEGAIAPQVTSSAESTVEIGFLASIAYDIDVSPALDIRTEVRYGSDLFSAGAEDVGSNSSWFLMIGPRFALSM